MNCSVFEKAISYLKDDHTNFNFLQKMICEKTDELKKMEELKGEVEEQVSKLFNIQSNVFGIEEKISIIELIEKNKVSLIKELEEYERQLEIIKMGRLIKRVDKVLENFSHLNIEHTHLFDYYEGDVIDVAILDVPADGKCGLWCIIFYVLLVFPEKMKEKNFLDKLYSRNSHALMSFLKCFFKNYDLGNYFDKIHEEWVIDEIIKGISLLMDENKNIILLSNIFLDFLSRTIFNVDLEIIDFKEPFLIPFSESIKMTCQNNHFRIIIPMETLTKIDTMSVLFVLNDIIFETKKKVNIQEQKDMEMAVSIFNNQENFKNTENPLVSEDDVFISNESSSEKQLLCYNSCEQKMESNEINYPVVCKFFQKGHCKKGNSCEYLHPPRQDCYFFVSKDGCTRQNCVFNHRIECRFYNTFNRCSRGDGCRFIHNK